MFTPCGPRRFGFQPLRHIPSLGAKRRSSPGQRSKRRFCRRRFEGDQTVVRPPASYHRIHSFPDPVFYLRRSASIGGQLSRRGRSRRSVRSADHGSPAQFCSSASADTIFAGRLDSASYSAPIAGAGQWILSGGMPSSASMTSSTGSSRHSATGRPTIISVSIDPDAIVGPRPTV
jgi:hypothetical protein